MPSKHDWEDGQVVERFKALFDSPVLLHVRSRILVHDRAKKGDGPCKCCGSLTARIVREIPDLDLLIDRVTGTRKLRSEVENKAGFDELAKVASFIDLPLRCHRDQLKLLLDTKHKVISAFGGARSGKTTVGATWMARQFMLRGGRGSNLWWVAPLRSQTMIGVAKLVTGEFRDKWYPPVFPTDPATGRPLLVAKWPETERNSDQRIVMLDGTAIALQHASRPTGANLKGRNVQAIMVDELCEIKHRKNWSVMIQRLADSGGSVFTSSTPLGGHWAKDAIIDAQKSSKDIRVEFLTIRTNPWIAKGEVKRLIDLCEDENEVLREVDGQWVVGNGSLWIHFDPKIHTIDDPTFNMVRDRQDVTAQACRGWWSGDNPYRPGLRTTDPKFVAGQDFNLMPMNTIIAKVFGDPQDPKTWGIYVLDEVQTWRKGTWRHGDWLKSDECRSGRVSYANIPIACDSTAVNYDPTQVRSSRYNKSNAAKIMADHGFDARACDISEKGYPQNPRLLDSISLLHQLMREKRLLIHGTRCGELIKAMMEQQVRKDGKPDKVSGTASDELSGPADALRYLAWALFRDEYEERTAPEIMML